MSYHVVLFDTLSLMNLCGALDELKYLLYNDLIGKISAVVVIYSELYFCVI